MSDHLWCNPYRERLILAGVCSQVVQTCMLEIPLPWSCAARNILKQLTMTMKARILTQLRGCSLPRPVITFEWDDRAPAFLPYQYSGKFRAIGTDKQMPDNATKRPAQVAEDTEKQLTTSDMQIFVKTIIGRSILIKTSCPITVRTLKERIREKEGIPEKIQRLVWAGKPLDDRLTLSVPNNGAILDIFMHLNLKGGAPRSYASKECWDPRIPQRPCNLLARVPRPYRKESSMRRRNVLEHKSPPTESPPPVTDTNIP